jgi:hypothetical protein
VAPQGEEPPEEAQLVEEWPVAAQRVEAQRVEAQPVEAQPAEMQPVEAQPAEAQPAEAQPVETQPEETLPVETQPEETQPVETVPVETQPEETQPVETQPVETQPVEAQLVEAQPVEAQPVEARPEVGRAVAAVARPTVFRSWRLRWLRFDALGLHDGPPPLTEGSRHELQGVVHDRRARRARPKLPSARAPEPRPSGLHSSTPATASRGSPEGTLQPRPMPAMSSDPGTRRAKDGSYAMDDGSGPAP